MMRYPLSQAALVFLMSGVCVCAADNKNKKKAPFEISADEQELLDLTNEARKKEKLPPLNPNKLLFEIARAHSANMAQQKQISHTLDGKGTAQRLWAAGYTFSKCAENIAAGPGQTLPDVMKAWMSTSIQRANILGKPYRDVGVGMAIGSDNQTYYTLVFGKALK